MVITHWILFLCMSYSGCTQIIYDTKEMCLAQARTFGQPNDFYYARCIPTDHKE